MHKRDISGHIQSYEKSGMCPHDISIHTNLYQNHSINGIKVVLYDLGSWKIGLFLMLAFIENLLKSVLKWM